MMESPVKSAPVELRLRDVDEGANKADYQPVVQVPATGQDLLAALWVDSLKLMYIHDPATKPKPGQKEIAASRFYEILVKAVASKQELRP